MGREPVKGRPEDRKPRRADTIRRWPVLRGLHLLVGIGGFFLFVETGQHMDRLLGHLVGMADGPRALYRSAHIYLLFVSLLHLELGIYFERASGAVGRLAQLLGSFLLLMALGCFLVGFYFETPLGEIERPRVRLGIYCSLAAVVLHGLGRLLPKLPKLPKA